MKKINKEKSKWIIDKYWMVVILIIVLWRAGSPLSKNLLEWTGIVILSFIIFYLIAMVFTWVIRKIEKYRSLQE